jgi:hypothetical protein
VTNLSIVSKLQEVCITLAGSPLPFWVQKDRIGERRCSLLFCFCTTAAPQCFAPFRRFGKSIEAIALAAAGCDITLNRHLHAPGWTASGLPMIGTDQLLELDDDGPFVSTRFYRAIGTVLP